MGLVDGLGCRLQGGRPTMLAEETNRWDDSLFLVLHAMALC